MGAPESFPRPDFFSNTHAHTRMHVKRAFTAVPVTHVSRHCSFCSVRGTGKKGPEQPIMHADISGSWKLDFVQAFVQDGIKERFQTEFSTKSLY